VVLLVQPETGDELQWEKAGVLEVADVVAVHKADLPGADQAAAQVRMALDLSMGRDVPVVRVSSKTGAGLAELWEAALAVPLRRHPEEDAAGELLRLAQEELAARFRAARANGHADLEELLLRWRQGQQPAGEARSALLRMLS
jgi:putative protein kinase ArgK-like GTPase of G3E family